jgi:hypothetical protein
MPELPIVTPGEIITSDHINDIADRTIQRYANVSDLTAKNPTPVKGEAAYLEDSKAFTMFDGTDWGSRFFGDGGAVGAPTFSFEDDSDTGIFRQASGQIGVSTNGIMTGLFTDAPQFRVAQGSEAAPGFAWLSDADTGMWVAGANDLRLVAEGVWRLRVDHALFQVPAVWTDTNAGAPNMVVTSDGRIRQSTSARRFKTNIQPAENFEDVVLVPVTFDAGGESFVGFIADDIAEQVPDAGVYDDTGQIMNYDLRAVVAVLAAKVNELSNRIETLEE